MGNPAWGILWFLCLITVAFPIAFFCGYWYVICVTCAVCIGGCKVWVLNVKLTKFNVLFLIFKGIADFLLKGLQLPHICVEKMIKCQGC